MSISTTFYFEIVIKCDGPECDKRLLAKTKSVPDDQTILAEAEKLRKRNNWRIVDGLDGMVHLCQRCLKEYRDYLERVSDAQKWLELMDNSK